jgi:two-component system, sensor histidine kinase and response regulator
MDLDTRQHGSDTEINNFLDRRTYDRGSGSTSGYSFPHDLPVSTASPQSTSSPTRPVRLMVVEDTPSSQKLFRRILEPAGYELHIAANGIEAIRDFARVHPDLIIMDLQMPVLDGLQTTTILRALDKHHPAIPIIATSARHLPLDRERFFAVGVEAFIPKPFDQQELLTLISQVLNQAHASANAAVSGEVSHHGSKENSMQNALTDNVININSAMKRLGNDQALMSDLVNFFFEDFPSLLEELRGAILRHDWNRLQRAAHSFKGLAANFDAAPTVQAMQAIELHSAGHDPEQLSKLLADAEIEVARLTAALAEYQQQTQEA